ncbi:MAG TPA: hypothetical protein VFC19_23090 [Candidatus Limnocylindrales bacterium]|nr:hypothetical protein [Candidatus Limnocylindrales bacterium]
MTDKLMEAGAILPGKAKAGSGQDTVTARRYTHKVLEKTYVRLVGDTVGPAEDLSMEFLGFEIEAPPVPVGHGRRQALGFPAWALVNDPANGRHALALVKDMERLARVAKSKPGNAKEGYDALADRLGGAAPQFLPTFWEQAGRAFLAADNQRMAGACFTLARRAEQVHGLPIDEERLREVHLEFAFAGALTAKMLTEFARGVMDRQPAPAAYELVRTLAVRRVAGGLAPQVSLADELAKMAKAAKLDPEAEAQSVVGQLITFPAMARAPIAVWKGYRDALIKLAKREVSVRARLLEIMPEPPGYHTDGTEEWLELLEATGAIDLLTSDQSEVPAGRWVERLMAHRQRRHVRRSARVLSLVERLVPRLLAEGRPVAIWDEHPWRAELDVVDLCLAKGVPPAGDNTHSFDVYGWAGDDAPGARDLTAIAADERLRPLLAKGVRDAVYRMRTGSAIDSPPLPATAIAATFGAAGLVEVYRDVLEELATQASGGTVLSLDELLVELAPLWSPAGAALAPAAFEALRTLDVAAMLGHSLRSGLIEEYTLPGFEAAAAQKLNLQFAEGWPALVVHDNRSAHIINPDGSVVEHIFRYPAAGSPFERGPYGQTFCHPVDGDLLVRWGTSGSVAGYWFSDPGEIFETNWSGLHRAWGVSGVSSLPLPGGGITRGGRPWHVGDTKPPEQTFSVAGDGVNFWRCEHITLPTGGIGWQWREFDPQTGAAGRVSVPSFFARPLPDGATLVPQKCELRPAPADFAGSPLGWHDGLVGWRVAVLPGGGQLGESVDGRLIEWHAPSGVVGQLGRAPDLAGALRLPGDDVPRPVTAADSGGTDHTIWTADGRFPTVHCGPSATQPPLEHWHGFKPRDPRGSAALRAVDDALARKLLAGKDKSRDKSRDKLGDKLGEVTDATLRAAVAELVERAAVLRDRLGGVEALLAAAGDAVEVETVSDEALRRAWKGLVTRDYYYYNYGGPNADRRDLLPQLRAVGKLLAGKDCQPPPVEEPAWAGLLAGPGAAALRAASPITDDQDRAALAGLLTALAESGIIDGGYTLRAVTLKAKEELKEVKVLRAGGQTTVLLGEEKQWDSGVEHWLITGFQRSPSSRFTLPPGMTLEEEIVPGGWLGGARLLTFTQLLTKHGPAPWRPESVERLVKATGMTGPEAAMLLAGLPGLEGWESNFLTPQQRSLMGVNVSQARVARDGLKELSLEDRVALLDAAMPDNPVALWETGPDIDALARRWIALRGRRVAVPDQLVTEAAKVLPKQHVTDVLQAIAQPSPGSWLTTDGRTSRQGSHYMRTTLPDGGSGTPFDGGYAYSAAIALAWLAYHLPWGDPVRAALPAALELARQRLKNPDLLLGHGSYPDGQRPAGVGAALVETQENYYGSTLVCVAPSRLDGPGDPALGFVDERTALALRLLLSRELADTVAIPVGAQGDPRDPRIGLPELVPEAAKRLGVEDDAAAYYLQLLALPDPTDRNVLAWNGWKAPRLKAVQKALTDGGHVLAAKRERAGRPVFLPGGWLVNRAPSPPMETWKASLYTGHKNLTLVTMPVVELFRTAWARVTSGDAPRYHDLKETR